MNYTSPLHAPDSLPSFPFCLARRVAATEADDASTPRPSFLIAKWRSQWRAGRLLQQRPRHPAHTGLPQHAPPHFGRPAVMRRDEGELQGLSASHVTPHPLSSDEADVMAKAVTCHNLDPKPPARAWKQTRSDWTNWPRILSELVSSSARLQIAD